MIWYKSVDSPKIKVTVPLWDEGKKWTQTGAFSELMLLDEKQQVMSVGQACF